MLRKTVLSLLVLVLVGGIALAATVEGTIKKVDAEKRTLVVTDKDKKEVTLTINKDAKVTLDGKAAKLSDLKEGQKAKVTHEGNKASEVEAKSAK